ncbi:MAG: aminoacyl-tRNA hydrolase [Croceimicrobium sp.]|nr:aminoacyl-tRNA hydrolase [Bacteroidota bacterium]
MNKYLIAGLGNIGPEYEGTRHNIGFDVLDRLLAGSGTSFSTERYARRAELKLKNKQLILIQPTTYMNLSGKAVNYWLQQERIPLSHLLVVVDDLALDEGTIRLKLKGSDGGQNGLKNINQVLGRQDYARLRFGIGNNFPRGKQVDYVLGPWSPSQWDVIDPKIDKAAEAIKSFALAGPQITMNQFNG